MYNATSLGIFLRRKMMFVHKSNTGTNYLAKCLTHVKCMYLLKCHKVNMILIYLILIKILFKMFCWCVAQTNNPVLFCDWLILSIW